MEQSDLPLITKLDNECKLNTQSINSIASILTSYERMHSQLDTKVTVLQAVVGIQTALILISMGVAILALAK